MKSKVLRVLLLLILASGIGAAIVFRDQLDASMLEAWVNNAGVAGPIIFMLIYIVGTVLFLPGSVLTLTGGALFGPVWGTFYNLTGATIGAAISFIVARYLLSDWVEQKTGGRLKQLKDGVEGEGWRFVAFVRLVPLFPFNLLNYALGLTRIKFSHYVITSYITMLPGAIAYTYLGYIGKEAATGGESIIQKSMLALALLAVVAFLPRLIRTLRKGSMLTVEKLKQKIDDGEDIYVLDVRSVEAFSGEQGHIELAHNIPVEKLAEELQQLNQPTDKPIAIVADTDKRSVKAARILVGNGFMNVQVTKGGMTKWNSNGYSTV